MKDHHYYTEDNPMRASCGRTEDHAPHKATEVNSPGVRTWLACPGWETTHVVEVREAGGRVVGTKGLDLRGALKYSGSTNDPLLTLLSDAEEAGQPRPSDNELYFGIAAFAASPDVCPWDSDRCHEHLYETADKLEEEDEE